MSNHPNNDYDTEEYKLGRLLHRISATLSILGSLYIIQNVLRDVKKKRKVANQVVVALSFADLFSSFFASILGQIPAPKGIVRGAIGNVGTCATSALLNSTGFVSSTYFNASLAITYLLMIKYGWKEERLQKNRIYLLGIPLLFSLPFTVTSIAMGYGNFNGIFCTNLAPDPAGCQSEPSTCERGGKLAQMPILQICGATLQTLISLPIVIGCMISLYWAVLMLERKNDQYRFDGELNREQSKRIAIQGIYYVWAFLIVEGMFVAVIVVGVLTKGTGDPYKRIQTSSQFLIPLQGFFNALVYLRPSYLEYLRKNPEKTISNRIRSSFGLEVKLPERNDSSSNKKSSSKGSSKNTNSATSSGDDHGLPINLRGNRSNRFTEGTYQGSTQGGFEISSSALNSSAPLTPAAAEQGGLEKTNSLVTSSSTNANLLPEKQHEEHGQLEKDIPRNDSSSSTTDNIITTSYLSSSASPHSSSPTVSRKATNFTGSIVDVDSDNSRNNDDNDEESNNNA